MIVTKRIPPVLSTLSSTPVTVTVCAVSQLVVVNVRDGLATAAPVSLLSTATVTSLAGRMLSLTV